MNKIKIVLIEGQRLFRDGIHALLKTIDDFEVLAAVENGELFMEQLNNAEQIPDVILMDMNTSIANGMEVTALIQKKHPTIKIIILTIYNQERFIIKLIEAGVAGYLVMNCEVEELTHAIKTVYKTGLYFNENTLKAMRNAYKLKNRQIYSLANIPIDITEREKEILKLICMEFTNQEIAQQLHISSRTVDGHRNNLLAKTGCKNTAGLVIFAVNNNIFESVLL